MGEGIKHHLASCSVTHNNKGGGGFREGVDNTEQPSRYKCICVVLVMNILTAVSLAISCLSDDVATHRAQSNLNTTNARTEYRVNLENILYTGLTFIIRLFNDLLLLRLKV